MDATLPPLNDSIALSLFSSRRRLFWSLQAAGWSGYFLLVYLSVVLPQLHSGNFIQSHIHLGLETASGLILTACLQQMLRRAIRWPTTSAALAALVLSALVAALWNLAKLCTFDLLYQHPLLSWSWQDFGGWYLFSLATMMAWTGLYFVFRFYGALQTEHHKALQAESAAREAQLKMLRYQLNPHFMFNTMNAISTLILKRENDTAGEMMDQLSQFLRSSLDSNPDTRVPLRRELESLDLYLNIEKVRFCSRLTIHKSIQPETLDALVPNLLLQPLAENAIKYAVSPRREGGTLEVRVWREDHTLVIQVNDDGPGMAPRSNRKDPRGGIGLSNTRTRLSALYGDRHSLRLENRTRGFSVLIRIPFETGTSSHDSD
ncbi:histidine kinase [Microbulbifer salipaludis]|uniref:Histidine kinase n=1 Tax=Microbulbifer salipaludis TaxID=187980 RepID=A0ABS3E2A5_9GAMM|nr:histidine kinase [Microbulbifer salipaludis]MBN8429421.1 histidine kinase [Microbulbifer salipaludis]